MFGNPAWFRPKALGFGLVPKGWQGWAYSAGWGSTIGLPFWLLAGRHQSLEAMLWLTLSIGAMAYDVWKILQVIRQPTTKTCPQSEPNQDLRFVENRTRPQPNCTCGAATQR